MQYPVIAGSEIESFNLGRVVKSTCLTNMPKELALEKINDTNSV